jgi:alkylated DNA nucleotide flippase Atl1
MIVPAAGKVNKLFIKTRRGEPMVECDALVCEAGLGIDGDVHANRLSPRQILVTLQSELDALALAPGALFENMVMSMADAAHFKPGAAIVTDGGVEVRLTMFCEPCKRIARVVPNLGAVVNRRGVLGTIVRGGEIRRGDAVTVIPARYAALPESPAQKFRDFVSTIPAGNVVRYFDVAIAMGVDQSFIRALPGYIRRHMLDPLPVHRIVNAQGEAARFRRRSAGQAGRRRRAGGGVGFSGFARLPVEGMNRSARGTKWKYRNRSENW